MTENPSQRLRRARPVVALALVSFVIGAVFGAHRGSSAASTLADQYINAWARGDYATMYANIDDSAQHNVSASAFASAYREALRTATATRVQVAGGAHGDGSGEMAVPVRVRTRLFGVLSSAFKLKVQQSSNGEARVVWSRSLVFPGLRAGELLSRRTTLPRRAAILARDGSVLAAASADGANDNAQAGSAASRGSPLGEAAHAVLGSVGPAPASRRAALEAQGVPTRAVVGLNGLERALDERLRGRPGGELLAGARVLAYAASRPAAPVRSTISPTLQSAAVSALGGQLGGIVAIQPSTGQILAVAGIGLDGLQPPGSTFKIVTLAGVLAAKLATPRSVFPYATSATLDGVRLSNANGEDCGGSLELAFAVSCNSVFTPLGVKLGAIRLIAAAEKFGFNHAPGVPGAAESTLPAASEVQGELDLGSTAIGQGRVLATPLEMATVAATIADGGRRPQPTFLPERAAHATSVRVTSTELARTVRHLMIGVVRFGTGTSAAIPGVTVAGKTGTAELKSICAQSSPSAEEPSSEEAAGEPQQEECQAAEHEASNTDAWFAAFAPALHPRIAVCVLLVKDGAGGDTAAPVARQVLEAGLRDEEN